MKSTQTKQLPNIAVLAILFGFILLSLTYSLVTRLKYGPDEPAHFIYIRSIATNLTPPPIAHTETPSEESTSSHEAHQPPLYYAILAIPYVLLKAISASDDTVWRVLRLLNILIGAAWIYSVYVLSKDFFTREKYALAATAFVALLPTATYTAGVINNEMLISLLFTCALIPILRYFRNGSISPKSSAILGLIIGLAILSKAQGLILMIVFLAASLAVCRRVNYTNYRQVLSSAMIVLGVTVLISGWWFIRSWIVYGNLMPHSLHNPLLPGGITDLIFCPILGLQATWIFTQSLYGHFIAPYWLMQPCITWSPYINVLLAFTAIAMVGFVINLRRNRSFDRPSLNLLIFTVLVTYLAYMRYLFIVDRGLNQQGRLLLSVAAVFGIIGVIGLDGWLVSERAKKIGLIVGILLMGLLNAAVIRCAMMLYAG